MSITVEAVAPSPAVFTARAVTKVYTMGELTVEALRGVDFDLFERDGTPPKVAACNGTYVFGGDALAPGCRPITGWV